jgi:hypothetical protein
LPLGLQLWHQYVLAWFTNCDASTIQANVQQAGCKKRGNIFSGIGNKHWPVSVHQCPALST